MHNMYAGSNICRYVILRETFSEGSLRVFRCCVGELLYMLKCVTLNILKWSFEFRQAYVLLHEIHTIHGHSWMYEVQGVCPPVTREMT